MRMQRSYLALSPSSVLRRTVFTGLIFFLAGGEVALAQAELFSSITEIELPVVPGAREPSLFAMNDGRILVSWTEPADEPVNKGFAVKTAIGDETGWADPKTVVVSDNLFVNWADYPSVAAFGDGTLAVHWLMENGPSSYTYDVNIALSSDNGNTWGNAIVPHRDGTRRQHGFATLLPVARDRMMVIWLDLRAYDINASGAAYDAFTNAAQLRTTTIGSGESLSDDTLLDVRTCTCCQTTATVTQNGIVLVAYRDRTAEEVRDISLVRLVDGIWSEPATIHADGWEISGCPVNGPAIDATGEKAVVAWFTAAQDIPVVNVAFSDDAGENFGGAIRIDSGDPAGRVDVLMLDDGSALVSWIEWTSTGEALLVCRARPTSGCGEPQAVSLGDVDGAINFPRMLAVGDKVYFAWTQPLSERPVDPRRDVTIRMVLATL